MSRELIPQPRDVMGYEIHHFDYGALYVNRITLNGV